MSRHGRHDDQPDTPRQDLFSDPYAGNYDPPPDRRGHDEHRYDQPSQSSRTPDDDDTTVLHFDEGVFDGPPPGSVPPGGDRDTAQPYAPAGNEYPAGPAGNEYAADPTGDEYSGYSNDEYAGGYSYAERDGGRYDRTGAEYGGPGAYHPGAHPDARTYPQEAPAQDSYIPDGRVPEDYDDGSYPRGSYAARGYAEDVYAGDAYGDDAYAEDVYADDHAQDQGSDGEYDAARRDDADRAAPVPVGKPARRRDGERGASARKKRGRVVGALAAVLLLFVVVGGGYLAYDRLNGPAPAVDFAGPAGPDVIVQVHPGDTAQQIGGEFFEKGVVASSAAFYEAAVQNPGMNALQPGFYSVPTNVPAVDAVGALVEGGSRVGALVVSEGRQLHDIRDVNTGAVRKGIYTLIAEASCYGDEGAQSCLTYGELEAAGASPDLEALGVPVWAREAVANVPDRARQLEGLIAAGSWDVDPSAEPVEVLRSLVSASASRYDETGITAAAAKVGLTPYELLVAASLVEREALPADFSKVARVILNRLDIGQMLQFDSTVNYALDETELATTDADRALVTPWNTYASPGLPATPISSPSIGALEAVENPEPGEWTYFVTIDDKGTTLFADSYEQHLVNTRLALESGILNSGR